MPEPHPSQDPLVTMSPIATDQEVAARIRTALNLLNVAVGEAKRRGLTITFEEGFTTLLGYSGEPVKYVKIKREL